MSGEDMLARFKTVLYRSRDLLLLSLEPGFACRGYALSVEIYLAYIIVREL